MPGLLSVLNGWRQGLAMSAAAAVAVFTAAAPAASATSAPTVTKVPPNAAATADGNTVSAGTADLAATMTGRGIAIPGGSMGFTITVANNGPDPASNVIVSDATPAGWPTKPTKFLCVGGVTSPGSGMGWCGPLPSSVSCTHPLVGSPGTTNCTTASLQPGASMTVVVALVVGFYFHNQAFCDSAFTTSDTFDPNPGNNQAGVCFRVN